MLSVIEITAISSAILYFLPITTATRLHPGLIQRIFQIRPIGPGEHEFEFCHTSHIPQHIPPTSLHNVHPVRPAHQQRPRHPHHRNRRNNRRQEEQDIKALVTPPPGLAPPPAPPYQAQENPIVHPNPPPTLPRFREPSIIILDCDPSIQTIEDHHSIFDQSPTPHPIVRVPRPILRSLSPDHVNTRLAICTGGPPLTRAPLHPTSTLTGWVANRETQRLERYFWADRHLDGASHLETLSFPEAEVSKDWTARKALQNYINHTRLVSFEIETTKRLLDIIHIAIFNDTQRTQYFELYTILLQVCLDIHTATDSVRFVPGTHHFIFIPSYQTVLLQDTQRRQDSAED
ncbi:hypothetical protein FIBSPDRAFT_894029 [Athelia psychrophila]|uniref:Uncharacterized protein n=1 Tax=Athelia psychrophila TaxID=1759441 RepID=A0A166GFS4_9AGAM|nr:hypothetical protein FIBSPDRAFT_894029 [Fibularhizoctonia sp. CBS 109695]